MPTSRRIAVPGWIIRDLLVAVIAAPVSHTASAMLSRPVLVVLLILNAIVLLGQLWPEGAPPFARAVNILFLVASLVVFALLVRRGRGAGSAP